MRRLWSPGWIASHLFAVVMIVTMTNLGFWQLRRLDERRASNDAIEAVMSQPTRSIAEVTAEGASPDDHSAVFATGVYLGDNEVLIANRSSAGLPGSWLATPLELGDGRAVAVIRGWVSRRLLAGLDSRSTAPPAGEVDVWGLAFASIAGGRIAVTQPPATPEISRMDLNSFQQASGVDVVDTWIRLTDQSPPQPDALPEPVVAAALSDGPHLSYAFQWFFFSAAAVVVYALILRRAAGGHSATVSSI